MTGAELRGGQQIFNSRPVELHQEFCLNGRFRQLQCSRCVAACPLGAISVEGAHPSLDASHCARCGICLHSCPTGAFSQHLPPENTLVFSAAQLGTAPITVACSLHPHPGRTPTACDTVLVHGRCLAALAPDHLLALTKGGERTVWLDDSPCTACPLGQSAAMLAHNVDGANALLSSHGAAARIYLAERAGAERSTRPRRAAVIDARQPHLSRRGFFGMVRHLAGEYASGAEVAPSSSLPPARSRLLAQLQTLPPADASVDTESLPFANVAINPDACTACGLCSRFCPTGALSFSNGDGVFQIDFAPAACVDCGICSLACPTQALHYTGAVPLTALADGSPHLLVQGPVPAPQGRTQSRTEHVRDRASLFDQLAGAPRRPLYNHQNGGVARPSCQSEGVSA